MNKSSQARHGTYEKEGESQANPGDSAQEHLTDMLNFLPQIDATKCIGCEICVKTCPNEALAMVKDVAIIANPAACDYASACQEICPTQAISLTYELVL